MTSYGHFGSFHPAILRAKAILESGELGAIKHAEVTMKIPKGVMAKDDIRFDYALGGGAMMDMGCTCPFISAFYVSRY